MQQLAPAATFLSAMALASIQMPVFTAIIRKENIDADLLHAWICENRSLIFTQNEAKLFF